MMWTQAEAIALCVKIENICTQFGCHVALTGGLLYKEGPRKDCDILFYRIRQTKINEEGLFKALNGIGITDISGFGFVFKSNYEGKRLEIFFPESDGEYPLKEPPIPESTLAEADGDLF